MSRLTRLREGADPELRALLRYYEEQEGPSAARVEALASRVVAGLAAVAGAGTVATATPSAPATATSGAAATATSGATWGATAWLSLAPASIWAAAAAVLVMGAGASFLIARRDAGQPVATPRAPHAAAPAAEPARGAQTPPSTATPAPSAEPPGQHGADAGAAPELPPTPAPPVAQRPAGPEQVRGSPASPTSEVTLLQRARQALVREPGAALALLELHLREYPDGVFVEEREALAIDALRRMGLAEQAAQRLLLFNARYPRSAYRERLRAPPARPR